MRSMPCWTTAMLASLNCASARRSEFEPAATTLLARAMHNDYEKATFSFEHGVRDDPSKLLVCNDWDVEFGNGEDAFAMTMVTDDCSRILDLGELDWSDVQVAKLPESRAHATPSRAPLVPAVAGHMYLVHTKDSNSECYALFRVERLIPGDSVDLSWSLVPRRSGP